MLTKAVMRIGDCGADKNLPLNRMTVRNSNWISMLSLLSLCAGIQMLTSCGGGSATKTIQPPPSKLVWTWEAGPIDPSGTGTYGTLGVASPQNLPAAHFSAACQMDASGNFWLFSGNGPSAQTQWPNDLWKYSNGEWTWMSGAYISNEQGSYGTLGVASKQNQPPGRIFAASWVDAQGNFWIFGGGNQLYLNDLWKFTPSSGEWAWMGGQSQPNQSAPGIYGTMGQPSPNNLPGPRIGAANWTDQQGNFWLYGGIGNDAVGSVGYLLGDMWRYANGEWTWMGGSNIAGPSPIYGTQGVPDAANTPGARFEPASWTDAQGNFWLFGGLSVDANLQEVYHNDLWEFSKGKWAWISGSDMANQPPSYGTQTQPAPTNVIGARTNPQVWVDAQGNFWFFGGDGLDPSGSTIQVGLLNDLWKFDLSSGEWTWMSGNDFLNAIGSWGTLGVPSRQNAPESRSGSCGWTDASGNLWLFGGGTEAGDHNDLWKYTP